MTNGLVKGRETMFINGYAVQYFYTALKQTKILIYCLLPENVYIDMSELTIDYIVERYKVESIANEKIRQIELY